MPEQNRPAPLVDSHCHLDLAQFDPDRDAALALQPPGRLRTSARGLLSTTSMHSLLRRPQHRSRPVAEQRLHTRRTLPIGMPLPPLLRAACLNSAALTDW